MRRLVVIATRPVLPIFDVVIIVVIWWVLNSTYDRWVKALVIVPALVMGGSAFVYGRWWRLKTPCEVKNCPNPAGPQLAATDVMAEKVYRRLCDDHWKMWVAPPTHRGEPWLGRDDLMAEWGWRGEAWWRD